ncbi:uncharacterized protein EV420DRAFT_71507 [Desarmillaria tabescens]|uniref:Uncharacterized protein n=1 Tax=Armillaria tabescens TaxID=1929756 RepID=A0AA39NQ82_ARMTA|nr:uncharacterized protein EV420DRAFT_71507 [Desarmillaria tabescens]KAK0469854.1 hypothetical protein EV420DRAFT_71507 [Desarmillaria tabescens]
MDSSRQFYGYSQQSAEHAPQYLGYLSQTFNSNWLTDPYSQAQGQMRQPTYQPVHEMSSLGANGPSMGEFAYKFSHSASGVITGEAANTAAASLPSTQYFPPLPAPLSQMRDGNVHTNTYPQPEQPLCTDSAVGEVLLQGELRCPFNACGDAGNALPYCKLGDHLRKYHKSLFSRHGKVTACPFCLPYKCFTPNFSRHFVKHCKSKPYTCHCGNLVTWRIDNFKRHVANKHS